MGLPQFVSHEQLIKWSNIWCHNWQHYCLGWWKTDSTEQHVVNISQPHKSSDLQAHRHSIRAKSLHKCRQSQAFWLHETSWPYKLMLFSPARWSPGDSKLFCRSTATRVGKPAVLVAKIINLIEIHNCVNLLDLLCAAMGAVGLGLFSFCLLLLKLSITTCLSPLWNSFLCPKSSVPIALSKS